MLLTDTAFSANVQQSMANIKSASKRLDEDMEALKHNFLTRGYFRKQAKEERKALKDEEDK
jgi:phospholipid/cholesterol/gamma-HCH transport system substrate-binding protein